MFSNFSIFILTVVLHSGKLQENVPIVITTWNFAEANERAWSVLKNGKSAIDAVEVGGSTCEQLQCDGTVGFGGSPDENGETTLDALIMDGRDMNVGAVGALREVKRAISVARRVLEHTSHSILVGELASAFAESMGFKRESLTTPASKKLWRDWHDAHSCQPNFWLRVTPDPRSQCGPYNVDFETNSHENMRYIDSKNHDTIGIVAIDSNGDIAAGTSTNGAKYKIPGRVGDSPIPGAGAYADNTVGGAAGTGDGDIMLRFLPSFLAVEEMRRGATPTAAALTAVRRIAQHYPAFMGAVVAVARDGRHGAACHGIDTFPYIVSHGNSGSGTTTHSVDCEKITHTV